MKSIKLDENLSWDFNTSLIIDGQKYDMKQSKRKLKNIFKNNKYSNENIANNIFNFLDKKPVKLISHIYEGIVLLQSLDNLRKFLSWELGVYSVPFEYKQYEKKIEEAILKSKYREYFKAALFDFTGLNIFSSFGDRDNPNIDIIKRGYLTRLYKKEGSFDTFFERKKEHDKAIRKLSSLGFSFQYYNRMIKNHENQIKTIQLILDKYGDNIVRWSSKKMTGRIRKHYIELSGIKRCYKTSYSSARTILLKEQEAKIKAGVVVSEKLTKKEIVEKKYKNGEILSQEDLLVLLKNKIITAKILNKLSEKSVKKIYKEAITKKNYRRIFNGGYSFKLKGKNGSRIFQNYIDTYLKRKLPFDKEVYDNFNLMFKEDRWNKINPVDCNQLEDILRYKDIGLENISLGHVSDIESMPRRTQGILYNRIKNIKKEDINYSNSVIFYLQVKYSRNREVFLNKDCIKLFDYDRTVYKLFDKIQLNKYLDFIELLYDKKSYDMIYRFIEYRIHEILNTKRGLLFIHKLFSEERPWRNHLSSQSSILPFLKDKDLVVKLWTKNYSFYDIKNDWRALSKDIQERVLTNLFNELVNRDLQYSVITTQINMLLSSQYFSLKDIDRFYSSKLTSRSYLSKLFENFDISLLQKEDDIQYLFDEYVAGKSMSRYSRNYKEIISKFSERNLKKNRYTRIYYHINKKIFKYSMRGARYFYKNYSEQDFGIYLAQRWYYMVISGVNCSSGEFLGEIKEMDNIETYKTYAKKYIHKKYHNNFNDYLSKDIYSIRIENFDIGLIPEDTFVLDNLHCFYVLNSIHPAKICTTLIAQQDFFKKEYPSFYKESIEKIFFREYLKIIDIEQQGFVDGNSDIRELISVYKSLTKTNRSYFNKHIDIKGGIFTYFNNKGINFLDLDNILQVYNIFSSSRITNRGLVSVSDILRNLIFEDFQNINTDEGKIRIKHLERYFKENLIRNNKFNIRDLYLLANLKNSEEWFVKDNLQNNIVNIFKKANIKFEDSISLHVPISINYRKTSLKYSKVIKLLLEESKRRFNKNEHYKFDDNLWKDSCSYMIDSFRMVQGLKEKGCTQINEYKYSSIHDLHEQARVLLNRYRNANIKFKYKKKTIKSEKFIYMYARSRRELSEWGNKLSHCIGSYWKSALDGSSLLIGVKCKETNKLVYTAQIKDNELRQLYGKHNSYPKKTDKEHILESFRKAKLIDCNPDITFD